MSDNVPTDRDLIDLGVAQGRAEERAAVVAWLRESLRSYAGAPFQIVLEAYADAIERGDHLPPTNEEEGG